MILTLAEQIRELQEEREEFNKFEPHVRAGIVMINDLRDFLLENAKNGVPLTKMKYELNPQNFIYGVMGSTIPRANVRAYEFYAEGFQRMFQQYVIDGMAEDGILVKWEEKALKFDFLGAEEEEE